MPKYEPNKYAICPKCKLNRFYVRHGIIEVRAQTVQSVGPTMKPPPPPQKIKGFEIECQNCGTILLQGVTQ